MGWSGTEQPRCILGAMSVSAPHPIPFNEDFEKRIASVRSLLSRNDRRIVDYIRRHLDELPFHTSDSLSHSVGVSQAAAIRFARRLGYKGFAEFRDLSREELQKGVQTLAGRFNADGETLPGNRFSRDIENLLATEAFIEDELLKAAGTIYRASTVHVLGDRESYGLASFLHRRLHTVLGNVRLLEPSFVDDITCVKESDVVVACLFKRYSRLTITLLHKAKAAGASVVLLTDGEHHGFISARDHILVSATESLRFHWSMIAPLAVIESLIVEVAAVDPRAARERLEVTDRFKEEQEIFL